MFPFSFHWYAGAAPPLVGVAVNVTLVPAQIVLSASLDAMLTAGVKFGFTVVVMVFDVAGEPVAQVALEVITTETCWPLVNADVLYVALFVPTLLPFKRH